MASAGFIVKSGSFRISLGLAWLVFLARGWDVLYIVFGQMVEVWWTKFDKNADVFLNGVAHFPLWILNK